MIDPIHLFRDGGPFMYLVLLVSPVAFVGALLPAVAAGVRRRLPTALPLALVLLPAGVGALGSLQGLGLVARVMPHASPEVIPPLAANGLSVTLYTVIGGAFLTGLLALLAAFVDGLASLVPHHDEAHAAATSASRRSGALVLASVGFAALGVAGVATRYAMMWQAMAQASRDMRGAMMASAMAGVVPIAVVTGGLAAICLAAAAVHAIAVPASRSPRTAIGAGLVLAVVLPLLLLPLLRVGVALEMVELARPWDVRRAAVLAEDPVALPTSTVHGPLPPRVTVRYTPSGPGRIDGVRGPIDSLQTVLQSDDAPRILRVEAPGNTRLQDLWDRVHPELEATVRSPEGELGTLYIGRAPAADLLPPWRTVLVLTDEHSELRVHDQDGVRQIATGPLGALLGPHAEVFTGEGVAHLPRDATLADAIALHEALRLDELGDQRSRHVLWLTTEPAPELAPPQDEPVVR